MGVFDILNASSIKKEKEKLQTLLKEIGAGDAIEINRKMVELNEDLVQQISKKETLEKTISTLNNQIREKRQV